MYIQILVPRGYSPNDYTWSEWFTRQHEGATMTVSRRPVPDAPFTFEILVDLAFMGVTTLRAVVGLADSHSNKATTYVHMNAMIPLQEWLYAAFDLELINHGASALTTARIMGAQYLTPEALQDTQKYTQDQLRLLEKQNENLVWEQSGDDFSADRHSAFTSYIQDNLDMDGEIDEDGQAT